MMDRKLAILSNGSTDMLNTLVRNSGLRSRAGRDHQHRFQTRLQASPETYTLIESNLGIPPAEVLFVSSNPFDACGAKAFGLNRVRGGTAPLLTQANAIACTVTARSMRRSTRRPWRRRRRTDWMRRTGPRPAECRVDSIRV